MQASHSTSTRASMYSKWALAAFGVVLAVGLGELAARVLALGPASNVVYRENYQLSNNPTLQYELVPGSRDGELRISSLGLRDRELEQPKPPGVYRILVLGDSIAYGFGVTARDALSAQLGDLLQARSAPGIKRFEVINLGVTGYNIAQVAEQLRVRGTTLQPDLIVYAYCLNDPEAGSFELQALRAMLSPAARRFQDARHAAQATWLDRSVLWLALRSALQAATGPARAAETPRDAQWEALRSGSHADYFVRLYEDQAARARLDAGMESLKQTAAAAHAPLVAAIFPLFVQLDRYPLRALHALVQERFRAHAIASYDLLPLYETMYRRTGASFVYNALHPSSLGQRLAAVFLREVLQRDGRMPSTAADPHKHGELAELDQLLERAVHASLAPRARSE